MPPKQPPQEGAAPPRPPLLGRLFAVPATAERVSALAPRLLPAWPSAGLWDPDAGGGRGVHLMHLRHPQPRRARAGSRTRPCDERFVPPLLSHPGGWKGKAAALGRGTNPSRCCKSALGVCPALQTLGVRAVPSPLWVAAVWRSELRNRASEPARTRTGALRRDWGQQRWHTQHQGQSWSLVPLTTLNWSGHRGARTHEAAQFLGQPF